MTEKITLSLMVPFGPCLWSFICLLHLVSEVSKTVSDALQRTNVSEVFQFLWRTPSVVVKNYREGKVWVLGWLYGGTCVEKILYLFPLLSLEEFNFEGCFPVEQYANYACMIFRLNCCSSCCRNKELINCHISLRTSLISGIFHYSALKRF